MARHRLTFRQRDVTAAVRAVERAGRQVTRVRIDQDGSIIVDLVPLPVASETAPDPEPNPWDKAIEDAIKSKPNPWDKLVEDDIAKMRTIRGQARAHRRTDAARQAVPRRMRNPWP